MSVDRLRETFHINRISQKEINDRLLAQSYRSDIIRAIQEIKDWGDWKTLAKICRSPITQGRTPVYAATGKPCIKTRNVFGLIVSREDLDCVEEECAEELKSFSVQNEDLLMNRSGAGSIGRVAIYFGYDEPLTNDELFRISISSPNDPGYVCCFLSSWWGERAIEQGINGSTGQLKLVQDHVASLPIALPSPLAQTYIGDKVRQAERLRGRSKELEKSFQLAIQDEYPEIFGAIQERGKHSWATLEDLSGSLNSGAYNPERLRIRRYLKGHGGKQIQNIATIETSASSIYHPNDTYIGLDAISSNSLMITPSTVKDSEVEGNSRVLLEGPVISKLRPYLNKVTYIAPELAGALGSTELLCVQPKSSTSGWFLYGVLKLESTIRQLNPTSTGSTHPRISREDVLDLIVPWHEESFSLGEKLRIAQEGYFAAERLTTAAKLLVEALIEGRVTELELQEAQEALQQGNTTLDRQILSRLTRKGIPVRGEKTEETPLFPDLDALYRVLSDDDDTDEDSDWDSPHESRQRWQTPIQSSRRAAEASTPYSQDATVTLLDEEGD